LAAEDDVCYRGWLVSLPGGPRMRGPHNLSTDLIAATIQSALLPGDPGACCTI